MICKNIGGLKQEWPASDRPFLMFDQFSRCDYFAAVVLSSSFGSYGVAMYFLIAF